MQPELRACNARILEFSSTVPLSDEQISKIRHIANPDKDGDSDFFDSYEGHRALAIVRKGEEAAKGYTVAFYYETRSAKSLSKRLPRIRQLIETLCLVKEQLNFECSVAFQFGKNLHARSIINLPMKYIEAPNMPFDRVQGLHLVKLDGNETRYDVYLEAPTRGVLFETVEFNHASSFDESLPDKILTKAKSISDKIVFTGSKDGENTKQRNNRRNPTKRTI
jgi:hypothetical protein